MRKTKIFLVVILYMTLCSGIVAAQEAIKPRPSPLAIAAIKHKESYVKVTYSQPHKRGRQVFGNLVPYGQIWRTGANEATEITTTGDISLNNQLLKAGTYSIFTIPDKEKWTIVINGENGLWGAYNYNAKLDVMRFEVTVQQMDNAFEAFTISFEDKNGLAELLLLWDKTKISIPVKFIN